MAFWILSKEQRSTFPNSSILKIEKALEIFPKWTSNNAVVLLFATYKSKIFLRGEAEMGRWTLLSSNKMLIFHHFEVNKPRAVMRVRTAG